VFLKHSSLGDLLTRTVTKTFFQHQDPVVQGQDQNQNQDQDQDHDQDQDQEFSFKAKTFCLTTGNTLSQK